MRKVIILLCFLLFVPSIQAFRISRPPKLTKKLDGNQITQLNNFLESIWYLQQGEFNFDITTSVKTNANNGDLWFNDTNGIVRIQYKANDRIFSITPDGY